MNQSSMFGDAPSRIIKRRPTPEERKEQKHGGWITETETAERVKCANCGNYFFRWPSMPIKYCTRCLSENPKLRSDIGL